MKSILMAGAMALGVLMAPQVASAAPITGSLDITGIDAFPVTTAGADVQNWTLASRVDFRSTGITGNGSGSFTGTNGSIATMTDFTFNPVNASPPFQIWSFVSGGQTYSLTITNISSAFTSGTNQASSVTVNGTGFFNITGGAFDQTPGVWIFTANCTQCNNKSQGAFSFSSSQSALSSVPEPAMLAMLGLGLIGVGRRYIRR